MLKRARAARGNPLSYGKLSGAMPHPTETVQWDTSWNNCRDAVKI